MWLPTSSQASGLTSVHDWTWALEARRGRDTGSRATRSSRQDLAPLVPWFPYPLHGAVKPSHTAALLPQVLVREQPRRPLLADPWRSRALCRPQGRGARHSVQNPTGSCAKECWGPSKALGGAPQSQDWASDGEPGLTRQPEGRVRQGSPPGGGDLVGWSPEDQDVLSDGLEEGA